MHIRCLVISLLFIFSDQLRASLSDQLRASLIVPIDKAMQDLDRLPMEYKIYYMIGVGQSSFFKTDGVHPAEIMFLNQSLLRHYLAACCYRGIFSMQHTATTKDDVTKINERVLPVRDFANSGLSRILPAANTRGPELLFPQIRKDLLAIYSSYQSSEL